MFLLKLVTPTIKMRRVSLPNNISHNHNFASPSPSPSPNSVDEGDDNGGQIVKLKPALRRISVLQQLNAEEVVGGGRGQNRKLSVVWARTTPGKGMSHMWAMWIVTPREKCDSIRMTVMVVFVQLTICIFCCKSSIHIYYYYYYYYYVLLPVLI